MDAPTGVAVVAVVAATLLAACAGPGSEPEAPSPGPDRPTASSAAPAPPAEPADPPSPDEAPDTPAYSAWELGAQVLPLRADGFGEVRPTPPSLRMRRYPTADVLPPPAGGFESTIGPVTPDVRRRMGETYAPGCPVALDDLSYVTVSFRGFDGVAHTGELVLAAGDAEGVVSVFRSLFRADFPIEEMRLPTTADLDAPPTGDGNNTAAMVCRATTGGTTFSAHAFGLAIDINPFQNPYERGDLVLPELAGSYLDRDRRRPGMVYAEGLVVREFARIGWSWGGDFQTLLDYQHFSATGR